jgi:para-nitrobenzyl esterase
MPKLVRQTPSGSLLGEPANSDGSVAVFRGIPYALPPVGVRRWRPAEPALPWSGTRFATRFGPSCPQMGMVEGTPLSHPAVQASEDCLYLNIWTSADAGERRPVMVWIHGGGLVAGSACFPEYDGANLARRGAVVVSINYRLGVFGYFSHPGLREESAHASSGNYGLSDQIQALRWVRDHITAFGGDPDNVTIFGESAGAWAVSQLMASPLARGLFHRAIGQSGSNLFQMRGARESAFGEEPAEAIGSRFAAGLGAGSVEQLRAIPADELMNAALAAGLRGEAVVDGWLIPDQILTIFAGGQQADVPVLVGFNKDEAATLASIGLVHVASDETAYLAECHERYGEHASEFLALYPASDVRGSTFAAYRDAKQGTWCAETWVRLMSTVSSPAYLYYFTCDAPSQPPGLGAYHMAEIPYVFANTEDPARFHYPILRASRSSPADLALADAMSGYWLAFARSGCPAVAGLPAWEAYTPAHQAFMEFRPEPTPGIDPLPGIWEFHDKVDRSRRASGRYVTPVFDPAEGPYRL